jgi:hypothetical protein
MKKLFTLVFLMSAFVSHTQRTMFGAQNNYVAPAVPVAAALTNQASFSWGLNQLAGNMPNYYIQATNLTLSQLPTSWSVQWTYKMDEGPGSADGMHWFFRNSSTTGKYSTQMHVYQTNGGMQFWYNSIVYAYSSVYDVNLMTNMTQGTTYKLALTYDGTNLKFYSNGVLKSTFAINITVKPTDSVLQMGSNLGRTIDEFRIWNSALSQTEISANQDVTAYGSSGLMLYYISILRGAIQVEQDGNDEPGYRK